MAIYKSAKRDFIYKGLEKMFGSLLLRYACNARSIAKEHYRLKHFFVKSKKHITDIKKTFVNMLDID